MSKTMKLRVQATTVMVGLSSVILTMGAPWKFG
jgi:hypothetical protein